MENTCEFDKCYFFGLLDDIRQCPNYMENGWKEELTGKLCIVKDCAPKRTALMVQDLYNRMIGVEKSQGKQRNEINRLLHFVIPAIGGEPDTILIEGEVEG